MALHGGELQPQAVAAGHRGARGTVAAVRAGLRGSRHRGTSAGLISLSEQLPDGDGDGRDERSRAGDGGPHRQHLGEPLDDDASGFRPLRSLASRDRGAVPHHRADLRGTGITGNTLLRSASRDFSARTGGLTRSSTLSMWSACAERPSAPDTRVRQADARTSWVRSRPSETQVLRRILAGQNAGQMARETGRATSTLRSYVKNILARLGAHSRLQAAAIGTRAEPVAYDYV